MRGGDFRHNAIGLRGGDVTVVAEKLAQSHGLHWCDMSEHDKETYRQEAKDARYCDVCDVLTVDWSNCVAFGIETTACDKCRSVEDR